MGRFALCWRVAAKQLNQDSWRGSAWPRENVMNFRRYMFLVLLLLAHGGVACGQHTPQQIIESKIDLWGEAALRQPGGPSYEFFANLLPPLRYVDARYKDYPIVLAAPRSLVKGKIVSNGSIINPLARRMIWVGESGTPWHIMVGERLEPFGTVPPRLKGPRYQDGYLPIVQLEYAGDDGPYREEVFAATDPQLAAVGALFVRLEFPGRRSRANQCRLGRWQRAFAGRREPARGVERE